MRVRMIIPSLAFFLSTPTLAQEVCETGLGITNGVEVADNFVPSVVGLVMDNYMRQGARCSGTIVSSQHVLTASHCLVDGDNNLVQPRVVSIGTGHYQGKLAQAVSSHVRSVRVNPADNTLIGGLDVAVLTFEPNTFDAADIAPLEYMATPFDQYNGRCVMLVGYGEYEPGVSNFKKRMGFNAIDGVLNPNPSAIRAPVVFTTTDTTQPAGSGSGVLSGDSGGPLMLVDFPDGSTCTRDTPDYYTRLHQMTEAELVAHSRVIAPLWARGLSEPPRAYYPSLGDMRNAALVLGVLDGQPGPLVQVVQRQSDCGNEKYEETGLCYEACSQAYYGDGPVCWETCPANTTDDGVTCGKHSYGRGVGHLPNIHGHCTGSHSDKQSGLCYRPCREDFHGDGPVCWARCATGTDTGASCAKHSYPRGAGTIPHLDEATDTGWDTGPYGWSDTSLPEDTGSPDSGLEDTGGFPGSCVDACGLQSTDGTCWCDDVCTELGDCCADIAAVCP